jgi:hypothetical protein
MATIVYLLIMAFFIVLAIKTIIVGLELMYKYAFTIFTLILLIALFV